MTLSDSDGRTVTANGTATVTAAAFTVNGGIVDYGAEGVTATPTLATFTDANPNDLAGSYTALIDWGDGTSGTGTVTGGNGEFSVSGTHVYATTGVYSVAVKISDVDGTTGSAVSTIQVGDLFAGLTSKLTVAVHGQHPVAPASSYRATIDWGDGSTPTSGTVSGSNGAFTVQGSHDYAVDSGKTAGRRVYGDGDDRGYRR